MLSRAVGSWASKLNSLVESESKRGHIIVIGVGHPLKADDYVGSLIAKDLRKIVTASGKVEIVDAEHSPENFVKIIERRKPSLVLFIDSLEAELPPGSIKLVDVNTTAYPFFSSHGIPLKLIAQSISSETRVVLLGIQPKCHDIAGTLSTEVRLARSEVVRELSWIIRSATNEHTAS